MSDEITTLMNSNQGKRVTLKLRNNRVIQGNLKNFDVHMNLTLEDAEDVTDTPSKIGSVLLRGDNILAISLPDPSK